MPGVEYVDFYIHSHYETGEYLYADPAGIHYEHSPGNLFGELFIGEDGLLYDELRDMILKEWPKYREAFVRVVIEYNQELGEHYPVSIELLDV